MALNEKASMDGKDERYFSRAVAKAFFMLDLLNESATPLALNEMAIRSGLTKTSAYRLLHTLQQLNFAEQSSDGRYTIGNRGKVHPTQHIANILRATDLIPASELLKQLNETVSVAVLFSNHVEVVRVFESTRVVRMANIAGRILSPHASSLGKAVTAFQPDDVQRQLLVSYGLVRFTANTIIDEGELEREFAETRHRGYSLEDEESTLDGFCLGVPLTLTSDMTIGGMSVSFPKSRMPVGQERFDIVTRLKKAAEGVCKELQRATRTLS
jgi:DNA-binding IclR family transcriptional regulator